MKITLSVDAHVIDEARKVALAMGKSLDQMVEDWLRHFAGLQQVEAEIDAFERSARATPGRLQGWRFDRDEANFSG